MEKFRYSYYPKKESREMPEKFDAVLVHGYWLSQRGDHTPVELSLRSHMATRAAAHLYNTGTVGKIVLTAGEIWGKDYPSVAQLMKEKLVRKYKVKEEDVIVADTQIKEGKEETIVNTKAEVSKFLSLAQENNWNNILSISSRHHIGQIRRLYGQSEKDVVCLSSEGILMTYGFKRFTRRFTQSKFDKGHWLYEMIKLGIEKTKPSLIDSMAKERSTKGPFSPLDKILPVDQYGIIYDAAKAEERKRKGYHYSKTHKQALEAKAEEQAKAI